MKTARLYGALCVADVEALVLFHFSPTGPLDSDFVSLHVHRDSDHVFLIASRRIPDIYMHVGGTHVHHLNYGIFLLAAVGAYLLLGRPSEPALKWATALYGIGLALTFDEFGMWLHLGGSYWQRASFDAIVVIAAFFGLVVVAPHLSGFRPQHWFTAVILILAIAIFGVMLADSFRYAHRVLLRIETLEESSPLN